MNCMNEAVNNNTQHKPRLILKARVYLRPYDFHDIENIKTEFTVWNKIGKLPKRQNKTNKRNYDRNILRLYSQIYFWVIRIIIKIQFHKSYGILHNPFFSSMF